MLPHACRRPRGPPPPPHTHHTLLPAGRVLQALGTECSNLNQRVYLRDLVIAACKLTKKPYNEVPAATTAAVRVGNEESKKRRCSQRPYRGWLVENLRTALS